MTDAVCMESSGCMVRNLANSNTEDINILFVEQKKTVEKVQAVEVSLAKMAAVGEFLKWAIPVAVTLTGVICSILTWVLTHMMK